MYTDQKKEKEKPFPPNAPRKPGSPDDKNASKDRPSFGTPDKSSTQYADEKFAGKKDMDTDVEYDAEEKEAKVDKMLPPLQSTGAKKADVTSEDKTSKDRPAFNTRGNAAVENANEKFAGKKNMNAEQEK